MRTLVVSDLHLGTGGALDVLRLPAAREALAGALEGVDRLVLLGDVVELRQGPRAAALEVAAPVLAELAGERDVLLVPGNHDHGLVRPWLEEADPAGLEARVAPDRASPAAAALARAMPRARVELAYPGAWLREDVYATHGHYLDLHTTVPTFERVGVGAMARLVGAPPGAATPRDYEAVLAPIYAWIETAAQHAPEGRDPPGAGRAARLWAALNRPGRRPLRVRALAAAVPAGVAAVNAAGLGPVRADLTGEGLRRGGLAGMREVVARLGVGARHVVFGHIHRTGPLPGDDRREWRHGETLLHNCGSWIHDPAFVGDRGAEGPYFPGGAIELDDEAGSPPRLRRLLTERDLA